MARPKDDGSGGNRTQPGPENTEKVNREGSTLGNIAREHGREKLGKIMDREAIKGGDQRHGPKGGAGNDGLG